MPFTLLKNIYKETYKNETINIDMNTNALNYKTIPVTFTSGGSAGVDNSVYFHVGANSNQVINTSFDDMRAEALGVSISAAVTATSTAIVKDTNNYEYRILNITDGVLWKDKSFKTFDDALMFLDKHPHCTNDVAKEIQLGRIF